MINILLKEKLRDYYFKYCPLYKELIDELTYRVFVDLINKENYLYYNFSRCIISLMDSDESDLDVGIYDYIANTSTLQIDQDHKGLLLGTFKTMKLDSLLINLGSFKEIKEIQEYINLYKFYQDFWTDYLDILLSSNIKYVEEIVPDVNLSYGEDIVKVIDNNPNVNIKRKIINRWCELGIYGKLNFCYNFKYEMNYMGIKSDVGEKEEENCDDYKNSTYRKSISYINPDVLFQAIKEFLLKNP